jgi:SNW domain-containing protein 1
MQQLLAQKEKTQKEENLRLLAQRAREERSGIAPITASGSAAPSRPAEVGMGLGDYGSDSEEESEEDAASEEDKEAIKDREQVRAEKRREREKEMRMSNMGTEMRAKMLAR